MQNNKKNIQRFLAAIGLGGLPPVTLSLIIITALAYILQSLSNLVFGFDVMLLVGAKINQFILQGEVWRFITPVFLHASVLHILFNMYALYRIGPMLEGKYGTKRFLVLYFISGLWGNTFSFLFSTKASLGASTAIFGLIAAQGIFIYQNRDLFGSAARPLLTNVIVIISLNLVLGLSPGIDNWGHFGGLLGGSIFAWFAGPAYNMFDSPVGTRYLVENRRQVGLIALGEVITAIVLISIRFLR